MTRLHPTVIIWALVLCAMGVGCSDSSDASQTGVPASSCAQPGDTGNENGVGRFCSPDGGECSGLAPMCLADVAPAEGQWFCTRLCTEDDQCGSDARCIGDERGSACVPEHCLGDSEPTDATVPTDA
jgi:hypothetical protein